ncbi:MAG: Gfo/Idh/MocA family oxidoreductase [Gemmatimonadota bacterium]
MKTYRVGIVGLGRMGSTIDDEGHTPLPYSIAAATRASARLELAAGCDLEADKRRAFGERWGVRALYADFREMVARERPDLVAICTTATGLAKPGSQCPDAAFRGDAHAELAVALAELEVPMLYVEKAMACSMARADEIRAAVHRRGTVFNTGVLRRFDNRYDVVRDAVLGTGPDGIARIGQPRAAVHFAPASLMHAHIHSIDTLSWLLGDPAITHVRGELLPRDTVVEGGCVPRDPQALYHLRFASGAEAWTVPGGYWEFEVLGTEGAVRSLNNGAGAALRQPAAEGRGWQEVPLPPVEPVSPVVVCLEDLVQAHETGRPTRGPVDVTHHLTEACLAVAESHRRGGAWVELPGIDRDLYVFHV